MGTPKLHIRPGNPDFLDLDWDRPIDDWDHERLVTIPTGIHRHPVQFVAYTEGLYAIKELPRDLAYHEFETLRRLSTRIRPVARPVGVVDRHWLDGSIEGAGAVITRYVDHAFPYRELVQGSGFGARRNQMLDAFAGLLVQLHLTGCFWGDCSLSNVLYRYDANQIEAIMIDAETSRLYETMTAGQRREDIEIMIMNVAGGMADIAASQGTEVDDADLNLGEDVAERYAALWTELQHDIVIGPDERYRIGERIGRLNDLGFDAEDVDLTPDPSGGDRVVVKIAVGGRNFHSNRLRELTRIEASENQARQILSDLQYHEARLGSTSATGKAIAAIRWRVDVFEPLMLRLAETREGEADLVQAYCDFLHHRFILARRQERDVPNDEAFQSWIDHGHPGYEVED
ncbi:MAG: DUF4032 domain-containing protein [Acidimicrobiia bacterium]|nr:DUF4032 domain-containing protein [Acidimicrobiia bacterium]